VPPAAAGALTPTAAGSRFVAATPERVAPVGRDWRAAFRWLNRSRRVLLTLAAVWTVSIFDLGYTLSEWGSADFTELNPVAAHLLGGPQQAIIAYKFGLLSLGTLILLALRRHLIAELACWLLFAAKVYLAVRWVLYFDCVLHGYTNPLIRVGG